MAMIPEKDKFLFDNRGMVCYNADIPKNGDTGCNCHAYGMY